MELARFDEVHVVSDLHMGGAPADFQILRETQRLSQFIRWVARQRPEGQVAFVLNGDVLDTLAEKVDGYIAVDDAIELMLDGLKVVGEQGEPTSEEASK